MKTSSYPHETSKDSSGKKINKHDFSYPSKAYSIKKVN